MTSVSARALSGARPVISITVVSRDGKRYELGSVRPGWFAGLRRWRMRRRVRAYASDRLRTLTDSTERAEFTAAIANLKESL